MTIKLNKAACDQLQIIAYAISDCVSDISLLYEMTDSGSMTAQTLCDIHNSVNDQIKAIEALYQYETK